MKKLKFIFTNSFLHLIKSPFFTTLLIIGLACSFIGLRLMYGMITLDNEKSALSTQFTTFTVIQPRLLDSLETLQMLENELSEFGKLSAITWRDDETMQLESIADENHQYKQISASNSYFGYWGHHIPARYFAESSGRFFTSDELMIESHKAYTSGESSVVIPSGFSLIGTGGCYPSLLLLGIGGVSINMANMNPSCILSMPDFLNLFGAVDAFGLRFYDITKHDIAKIFDKLSSVFPEAKINIPISTDEYYSDSNNYLMTLCAIICTVALINVFNLFLFVIRNALEKMKIFALCGARRIDFYLYVFSMWFYCCIIAFIVSLTLIYILIPLFSFFEISSSISPYLLQWSFVVTWTLPNVLIFPSVKKQIDSILIKNKRGGKH